MKITTELGIPTDLSMDSLFLLLKAYMNAYYNNENCGNKYTSPEDLDNIKESLINLLHEVDSRIESYEDREFKHRYVKYKKPVAEDYLNKY